MAASILGSMATKHTEFAIAFLILIVCNKTAEAQIFHSIHRLHLALQSHAALAGELETYITKEEQRLESLKT